MRWVGNTARIGKTKNRLYIFSRKASKKENSRERTLLNISDKGCEYDKKVNFREYGNKSSVSLNAENALSS
jgi:hypothetical protein